MIPFAELNVIADQFSNRRIFAADRAVLIAVDFQLAKLHSECVVHHQAADKRFTYSDQQLDHFSCHHQTNYAWEHAQDACLVSTRHHARWRRRWIHASIARSVMGLENSRLSFKLEDTAVYNRFLCQHGCIID